MTSFTSAAMFTQALLSFYASGFVSHLSLLPAGKAFRCFHVDLSCLGNCGGSSRVSCACGLVHTVGVKNDGPVGLMCLV